jgi:hypothetical protein
MAHDSVSGITSVIASLTGNFERTLSTVLSRLVLLANHEPSGLASPYLLCYGAIMASITENVCVGRSFLLG